MRSNSTLGALAILSVLLVGCGSDTITTLDPLEGSAVAGTYSLTALSFNPQGTLPQADILARIEPQHRPTLTLTAQGGAQIVYQDPATDLSATVNGTFVTTSSNVVVDFGTNDGYRTFLLSRDMSFAFSASPGSLTFESPAPDGVSRERLVGLVPEWQTEQLLDPTPGSLRVVFTRSGG